MKRFIPFLFLFAVLGCKDVIVSDITNQTVGIILPMDQDTISQNPVQFKWAKMNGAFEYKLEVVYPSFDNIKSFVYDTIVSATELFLPLDSNAYQYRVTGKNSAYSSKITEEINFFVGFEPKGFSDIIIQSPLSNSYYQSLDSIEYNWSSNTPFTSYEFTLRKGNSFESSEIIESKNNIASSPYMTSGAINSEEGTYHWGIKGYLDGDESTYFKGIFYIDTTSPSRPVLLSPNNNSILSSGSIDFSWTYGPDSGSINSPISFVFELANDVNFNSIIVKENISNNSFSFELAPGTYFWQVQAKDAAGNLGDNSMAFQLQIQ